MQNIKIKMNNSVNYLCSLKMFSYLHLFGLSLVIHQQLLEKGTEWEKKDFFLLSLHCLCSLSSPSIHFLSVPCPHFFSLVKITAFHKCKELIIRFGLFSQKGTCLTEGNKGAIGQSPTASAYFKGLLQIVLNIMLDFQDL